MTNKAFIAGVGMIPFAKPGAHAPYPDMAAQATRLALADAGVGYDLVQQAYVGYVYGDSTAGQKALYGVGMTGIPIVNVNNNCSTGSTALFLARQAVESGAVDCVLALGFEPKRQKQRGWTGTGRAVSFHEGIDMLLPTTTLMLFWVDGTGYWLILGGEPLLNNRALVELIWGIRTAGTKFAVRETTSIASQILSM